MTAERAPARRVVTLIRSEHAGWWPEGYWGGLVGCGIRMPAVIENGRVIEGLLVAADEGEHAITLTFAEVAPAA